MGRPTWLKNLFRPLSRRRQISNSNESKKSNLPEEDAKSETFVQKKEFKDPNPQLEPDPSEKSTNFENGKSSAKNSNSDATIHER